MDSKIYQIYENIYNQELNYKNSIDSKFTSRFTILISLITAISIIVYSVFWDKSFKEILISTQTELIIKMILFLLLVLLTIDTIYFYKSFFRKKKNYSVMPNAEIRMFHFYIHKNGLLSSDEEIDFYNYLIDCYQFCAYHNSKINSRRESAVIILDNTSVFIFIIILSEYLILNHIGYSIKWIF